MKKTINRLASSIIDLTGEIGLEAETLAEDPGIASAECVIHLRDAQRALNHARDSLRLALANPNHAEKPAKLFTE